MILAFSTSSPWASVSLMRASGEVLWSGIELAPRSASAVCLALLERAIEEVPFGLTDVKVFAADVGPGSFTGVRVGVVLAKTLAWNYQSLCAEADSFDLVDPASTVALPSKKGEFFVRFPGTAPYREAEVPPGSVGFGFGEPETPPHAERFSLLMPLVTMPPEQLVPRYLIEASISQPKKPLSRVSS